MKKLVSVCLAVLLVTSSPAFARDGEAPTQNPAGEPQPSQISVEEIPTESMSNEEEQALRNLFRSGIKAFETEPESATLLRKFIGKFNFKQVALNAKRWYGMERSASEKTVAANIAAMLLVSHFGIEAPLGPMISTYAALHDDMNVFLRAGMFVGGILTLIPFADPVCIVLIATYDKFPRAMNRLVGTPRLYLVKGMGKLSQFAGFPKGFWSNLRQYASRERLRGRLANSDINLEPTENGYRVNIANTEGREIAKLELLSTDEQNVGLSLFEISPDATPEERESIGRTITALGANISGWAKQLAKNAHREGGLEFIADMPYVQEITDTNGGLRVKTDPKAFKIPNACTQM